MNYHFAIGLVLVLSPSVSTEENSLPSVHVGAEIAALARASEGKVFGRGECWDFAAELLDRTNCDWNRPFAFGQLIDPKTSALQPGDILQFESVKIEWKREGRYGTILLGFPSHTAIVLSAAGSVVEIAHQNYNRTRKVSRLSFDLKDVTAGKWRAFRPVKKAN